MEDFAPVPQTPLTPQVSFDLQGVLDADPIAKQHWEELTEKQQRDWIQYLAEGTQPARRAIRLANLLMSITDE